MSLRRISTNLRPKHAKHIDDHFASHRPYEQGEAAASFVRSQLNLASVQFVEIFEVVEGLGASLHT